MNKTTLNSQKEKHSILSLRRATCGKMMKGVAASNFYPRSPCDGGCTAGCDRRSQISIHALLAESDGHIPYFCARYTKFLSTLSLRRATHQSPHLSPRLQFLSTLSLRRATAVDQLIKHIHVYFYPRSPCGERHSRRKTRPQNRKISIHALLAESDAQRLRVPARQQISIHALLAESDG